LFVNELRTNNKKYKIQNVCRVHLYRESILLKIYNIYMYNIIIYICIIIIIIYYLISYSLISDTDTAAIAPRPARATTTRPRRGYYIAIAAD